MEAVGILPVAIDLLGDELKIPVTVFGEALFSMSIETPLVPPEDLCFDIAFPFIFAGLSSIHWQDLPKSLPNTDNDLSSGPASLSISSEAFL